MHWWSIRQGLAAAGHTAGQRAVRPSSMMNCLHQHTGALLAGGSTAASEQVLFRRMHHVSPRAARRPAPVPSTATRRRPDVHGCGTGCMHLTASVAFPAAHTSPSSSSPQVDARHEEDHPPPAVDRGVLHQQRLLCHPGLPATGAQERDPALRQQQVRPGLRCRCHCHCLQDCNVAAAARLCYPLPSH